MFLTQSHSIVQVEQAKDLIKRPLFQGKNKWQKIIDTLQLKHEQPNVCQPAGFNMYQQLAKGNFLQKYQLVLNIPETLIKDEDDNIFVLSTRKGRVTKERSTPKLFEAMVEQAHRNSITRDSEAQNVLNVYKNSYIPYIVSRTANTNLEQSLFDKQMLTYKTVSEVRCKASKGKIMQRYIYSRNMKALLLRFGYFTKHCKTTSKNFMYRAQNVDPILKYNARSECYESFNNIAFVVADESREDSFTFSTLSGKMLQPYCEAAQNLVTFLEKTMPIRISRAYIDFITGIDGKVYLTNLRWVELAESLRLDIDSEILTCTVCCKLCGLIFKRGDVSKTLTYKLLFELVEHYKRRTRKDDHHDGLLYHLHFNQSSNKPCQLCDVCYMLVVSQHQLIRVERELAKAVNIKIKEEVFIDKVDIKNKKRPVYLPDYLHQWRLMFYFAELRDMEGCEMAGDLNIQYRLNNLQTFADCFYIGQPNTNDKPIKKMRVHYFFSETLNIEKFLAETEIKIRITQGTDWNKFVAEGSSGTISHFKNKAVVDSGQRHSSKILLFSDNCKYCQLSLMIGLVLDGVYNTVDLNMYKEKQIYLSDSSYYNCNILPEEWMELFSHRYAEQMKEGISHMEYSPVCTEDEIRKIIGLSKPKDKFR